MTARGDRRGVRCRCTCPGATVWVTGGPVADRLAAAYALAERLLGEGRRVEVLDRFDALCTDAHRVGIVAEVLARNGVVAVVPCAPRAMAAVRARHRARDTRYLEVRVNGHLGPEESVLAVHRQLTGRP